MRLCFVIPKAYYTKINSLISSEFQYIHVEYIFYQNYIDVPELIRRQQGNFDAIIFGGQAPYNYASNYLKPECIWFFFPKAGSTILRALLAAQLRGWDIKRLSFDTSTLPLLQEVYAELDIAQEELEIRVYKGNTVDINHNQNAFLFHRENLRQRLVDGCITGLYRVHEEMEKERIAHVYAYPTFNVIREQIYYVEKMYRIKKELEGNIVAIFFNIGFPNEHSILLGDDYQFAQSKIEILRSIYQLSYQIHGIVSEESNRDFLIFTTKDPLEIQANFYQDFFMLYQISEESRYLISIGVGYGDSLVDAKKNSVQSMLRAKKHTRSAVYVQFVDGTVQGPIFNTLIDKNKVEMIDPEINWIAERSGISCNTVYKLICFTDRNKSTHFTSKELAEGINVSKRSADRLLEKLEKSGYAFMVGKKLSGGVGRPRRIMRIDFNRS